MEKRRRLLDEYRFPGFSPRAEIKGIFGDPKARVIRLKRTQKNDMRVLWEDSLESLRQEGASGTGFILWRCTDLSGSGGENRGENRDSDYFMVFSVLRGCPHGKALNLLPNNFSSLFIKLSSPHGLPVIEHFFMFFIICSSSFSRKYFNQSSLSSSK